MGLRILSTTARGYSANTDAKLAAGRTDQALTFAVLIKGAGLLALQGLAEALRCMLCIRDNRWPQRLHDVEELERVLAEQHAAGEALNQGNAK